MFVQALEALLRDHCTAAAVREIEQGASCHRLWQAFSATGFVDLLRPESEGGAGLALAEFQPVLDLLGRCAPPVPFAQAMAARALVAPGVVLPDGPLTLAAALSHSADGRLHCLRVPYGRIASHVLAADGDRLLLLDAQQAQREHSGLAGSLCASLSWEHAGHAQPLAGDAAALVPMAAAVHAALMAGAMQRVFQMTLQYCNERQQFGRPLGKFQAVQHQLSVMAEHTAAASMAAEAAFETAARTPTLLRAALAKARASEAVCVIADTAHALHGAIGVTEEYELQLHTRRLHEWRWQHGSESHWNRLIGQALLAAQTRVAEFVRTA